MSKNYDKVKAKVEAAQNRLSNLKVQRANAEGRRDEILSQLKEKYGISSLEQAKEFLAEQQSKLQELETSLTELEEELNVVLEEAKIELVSV
jgi:phenylalanyl-tRNA synthetase alpha subunit